MPKVFILYALFGGHCFFMASLGIFLSLCRSKYLHCVKNISEKVTFLRFIAYFCHSIDDFACFCFEARR